VPGPNFLSMSSNATTGTFGFSNSFNLFPNLMPIAYNNGQGATRMIVYARDTTTGTLEGGTTSSTSWVYARISGLTPANYRDLWKSSPAFNQSSAPYTAFSSSNIRSGATVSGTVFILGGHGSGGGVNQWVSTAASNFNNFVVFEYKPVGYAENNLFNDPFHYWMVETGVSASTLFRSSPFYGNNAASASGVLGSRFGGIAIF
jgi:hypothetical protein